MKQRLWFRLNLVWYYDIISILFIKPFSSYFFSNTQHTGNNYRFLKHNCYMFMNLLFGKLIVIHIYFRYQSSLSHLHLKLYYFRVRSIRMSKNYPMIQYRYHNISCKRYYNYFCVVGYTQLLSRAQKSHVSIYNIDNKVV